MNYQKLHIAKLNKTKITHEAILYRSLPVVKIELVSLCGSFFWTNLYDVE